MAQELDRARVDFELILVANYVRGSQDRTPSIVSALALADPRIHCVAREKEGMMGWDLRSGLAEARGAFIATIDGDGQMPPSDVVRVYERIRSEGCDLVKTYRVRRDDGLLRWTVSLLFNVAFRSLFWRAASWDINSKPKVLTRAAYSKMRLVADDWFADAEIMIEAGRHDMAVTEIPTVFYKNTRRASFVHVTAIWEFVRNLLRYRFLRFPPLPRRRDRFAMPTAAPTPAAVRSEGSLA